MVNRNRYDFILDGFESRYKRFFDQMVDWYSTDRYEIVAILDDGMKLTYNYLTGKIRFLKDSESKITEEDWVKDFSMILRQKIFLRGMSQGDLSEATGISKVSISKYMTGKSIPSYYNMTKIAQALECSVSEFTNY